MFCFDIFQKYNYQLISPDSTSEPNLDFRVPIVSKPLEGSQCLGRYTLLH